MVLLIVLPVLISLVLFGLLWVKFSKKNTHSLLLLIISVLTPFLQIIDYKESALFLAVGMMIGWVLSLIRNEEINNYSETRIVKLILSNVFLFSSLSFIISGPVSEVVLWNNYYQELIVQCSIGMLLFLLTLLSLTRIRKILSTHQEK